MTRASGGGRVDAGVPGLRPRRRAPARSRSGSTSRCGWPPSSACWRASSRWCPSRPRTRRCSGCTCPSYLTAVKSAPEHAVRGRATGSAPRTTRSSSGCTRPARWSAAARCSPRGRSPRAAPTAPSTSPAGCTTRCADRASGFCVYNDCAVAISWLLDHGFDRIAYVDVDVHHGDGVQAAFYADPRVLTISLHQHPMTLWPGTGWPRRVRRRARPRDTRSTCRCRRARPTRLAACVPRGRAVAARGVPAADPGHPVRGRHPRRGSAGRPRALRRRPPRDLPGAARAGRRTPRAASGSPSAAAGTGCSGSCRGRGRT